MLKAANRLRGLTVKTKPACERLEFLNEGDLVEELKTISREDIDDKWKPMTLIRINKSVEHWVPQSDWRTFKAAS